MKSSFQALESFPYRAKAKSIIGQKVKAYTSIRIKNTRADDLGMYGQTHQARTSRLHYTFTALKSYYNA